MGEPEWPPDLFESFGVFVAIRCGGEDDEDDILELVLMLLLRSRLTLALTSESNGVRHWERS